MPPTNDGGAGRRPRQNDAHLPPPAQVDRGMHHAPRKLRLLIAARDGKSVAEISQADTEKFVTEFVAFCSSVLNAKLQKRTVARWFAREDSTIYNEHRGHVLAFFHPQLPFLLDAHLSLSIESFETEIQHAQVTVSQSVVIEFPIPLRTLTAEDREFLCGIYELYRYSFANDGGINLDLLTVTPDPAHPNRLRMDIIVEPLAEGGLNESFGGYLYAYGRTLLGVPVLNNADSTLARVRRFEFPVESLTRTRENLVKIGIVAGNSVQLHGPVAAKCLISKISNAHVALPEYLEIVKRYPPSALYKPYVEAICNDIRRYPDRVSEQDDYLLSVQSSRKPRVRPRNTFPHLPNDPKDPHAFQR